MTGEVPDLTRPDLEELQLERLRESLRHAVGVPHSPQRSARRGCRPTTSSLAGYTAADLDTWAELMAPSTRARRTPPSAG